MGLIWGCEDWGNHGQTGECISCWGCEGDPGGDIREGTLMMRLFRGMGVEIYLGFGSLNLISSRFKIGWSWDMNDGVLQWFHFLSTHWLPCVPYSVRPSKLRSAFLGWCCRSLLEVIQGWSFGPIRSFSSLLEGWSVLPCIEVRIVMDTGVMVQLERTIKDWAIVLIYRLIVKVLQVFFGLSLNIA
jgi:hypothetical protein